MSEYRRLISYIYEYEGKEKGKNVGFVKLENRNGQCRLNLSVKRIYVGGNAIGVYLLGKDRRETFLGNIFVRGGNGEFRAVMDAQNVGGSGCGLDTYYGLTVHDVKNPWRSYTTIWEDAVLPDETSDASTGATAAEVLPGAPELPARQELSQIVREIEDEMAREDAPAAHVDEKCMESEPLPPGIPARRWGHAAEECVEPEPSGTPDEIAPPKGSEPSGTPKEVVPAKESEPVGRPEEIVPSKGPEPVGRPEEIVPPKEPKPVGRPEEIVPAKESEPVGTPEEVTPPKPAEMPEAPGIENPGLLRYLRETEEMDPDPEKLWQDLRRNYPKMQPFDYDGECEILAIRPQDIGRLPRESWVYGNNSFLLHGYYSFRYLILVRLCGSKGRPRYLIGVPGHYYSNEKYMASMFGFPNFVLSKKQPPNDGRFGYWYTDIRMHRGQ